MSKFNPSNVNPSKVKQAFTLVELLVVIAIIGVLVALLLPAVQSARESARRSQCTNNIKQATLAMHNYTDTYSGSFPVGEYGCCWGTWMVGLLPYVEQKALFDQYRYFGAMNNPDLNTRYGGSFNLPVTTIQLKAFTCPSDQKSLDKGARSQITYHNYVANHGNTTVRRQASFGTTSTGQPNQFNGAPFIHVDSTADKPQVVRMAEVVDGLSNTLAFSETVQGQQGDLRGFTWWYGAAHFETYLTPNSSQPDALQSQPYCQPQNRLNPPCIGPPTTANPEMNAARSRHPNGVQASMCDGSVRFVSKNVFLDTWRGLGTNLGGESLTDF
jgi:prepilin-type N-terminal cleavage/methylation domain-containing protein/prepilin-type processing-associated H-X9-DG protein